ncbi:MAG: hypothetical protein WC975_07480 [Phycisphaerae bacterium]
MADPDGKGESRFSTLAHLFLSEIRSPGDEPEDDGKKKIKPAIKRVGPNGKNYSCPSISHQMYVIGVCSRHLRERANKSLGSFARSLAGEGKIVVVLKLDNGSAYLDLYYPKSNPQAVDDIKEAIKSTEGICARLDAMTEKLDYVLLDYTSEFENQEDRFANLLDSVCVLTTPDSQNLIASYQVLKSLNSTPNRRDREGAGIGLFVDDVRDLGQAQAVYDKLAKTALEFTGMKIENNGYSRPDEAVGQELLAQNDLGEQSTQWLTGLESWLKNHKTNKIENNADECPLPDLPAAKSLTREENQIVILESVGDGRLAEIIGGKIIPGGRPANDSLIAFLRAAGLDCAKFQDTGGRVLVLVLMEGDDPALLAWVMEHYPNRDDKLILATDKQMGHIERSTWPKHFGQMEIKRILCGKLDGRQVAIMDK